MSSDCAACLLRPRSRKRNVKVHQMCWWQLWPSRGVTTVVSASQWRLRQLSFHVQKKKTTWKSDIKGKINMKWVILGKKNQDLLCNLYLRFCATAADIIGFGLAATTTALFRTAVTCSLGVLVTPLFMCLPLQLHICLLVCCVFLPVFNKSAIPLSICRLLSSVDDGARGQRAWTQFARTGNLAEAFTPHHVYCIKWKRRRDGGGVKKKK